MDQAETKALLERIYKGIRVTKVVATRSVKGRYGDTFVGFSAAWNSVQEDGGQGLVEAGDDQDESNTVTSMGLKESMVASCILSREVDIAAYRSAAAGGNITLEQAKSAIASVKSNYSQMLAAILEGNGNDRK